ncbi:MAG: NapC/NirT family cytochrome c [Aeromonas sp.]
MKVPAFVMRLWRTLIAPPKAALWLVVMIGFFGGVIFWGGFNTAMEASNSEAFCIGCHEMRENVFEEYRETIHYSNRSGVRASCPDCHVPHEWTYKMIRKVQASKELWGKLTGKVDTPEKFESHRRAMAEREWTRMQETDSRECRNCHNFDYMDFTQQSARSAYQHQTGLASGDKTCIDCHKGIAHKLPDMTGVAGF